MGKLSKKEIKKRIQDTWIQISNFERSIKDAPKENRNEFKNFVRKNRIKLRQFEKLLEAGNWRVEE
jgi:hypothetical protein